MAPKAIRPRDRLASLAAQSVVKAHDDYGVDVGSLSCEPVFEPDEQPQR